MAVRIRIRVRVRLVRDGSFVAAVIAFVVLMVAMQPPGQNREPRTGNRTVKAQSATPSETSTRERPRSSPQVRSARLPRAERSSACRSDAAVRLVPSSGAGSGAAARVTVTNASTESRSYRVLVTFRTVPDGSLLGDDVATFREVPAESTTAPHLLDVPSRQGGVSARVSALSCS